MGDPTASSEDQAVGNTTEIRTFLIADVRGYTLFTQERGDEAAAKLAARFADVAQEAIEARSGSLIELRGDEALAAFGSARQAIRAALELQERFVEETKADPEFALPVGIGLDAGEGVPVAGGYRGGALNLAARLCARAGPGEVLASQGVRHLARKVEGATYRDLGEFRLKGLAEPVRVFRVTPEGSDPAAFFSSTVTKAQDEAPPAPAPRRRLLGIPMPLVVAAAFALIATIVVPIAVHRSSGLSSVQANAVGLIDLPSGRIAASVPVGASPSGIAAGAGPSGL